MIRQLRQELLQAVEKAAEEAAERAEMALEARLSAEASLKQVEKQVERLTERLKERSRKTLLHWLKGSTIGPAFNRMREHCAERQRLKKVSAKALIRINMQPFSKAWNSWLSALKFKKICISSSR